MIEKFRKTSFAILNYQAEMYVMQFASELQ